MGEYHSQHGVSQRRAAHLGAPACGSMRFFKCLIIYLPQLVATSLHLIPNSSASACGDVRRLIRNTFSQPRDEWAPSTPLPSSLSAGGWAHRGDQGGDGYCSPGVCGLKWESAMETGSYTRRVGGMTGALPACAQEACRPDVVGVSGDSLGRAGALRAQVEGGVSRLPRGQRSMARSRA